MTCSEFRSSVEGSAPDDRVDRRYSAEAAEHVGACAECSRFAREQTELRGLFEMVRNAAPPISPALDGAVLANFRKRSEGAEVSTTVGFHRPFRLPASPFWRGAITAMVLLAVILPLAYQKSSSSRHPTHTMRTVRSPLSIADNAAVGVRKANPSASTGSALRRPRHKASASAPEVSATGIAPAQVPPGFNSLMYCDPLSCSGTMEVIRMQIPTAVAVRGSQQQSQGVVFADIIVGPDGVARGIRFLE